LKNGTALFRNRFVRTEVFTKERRLQRIVARGAFGTPKTGGVIVNFLSLRTRDVANTNVLYWAGRLLALFESATPHEIAPDSLCTIRKSTLGGVLKPNQPFSAHPRVEAKTGRLINFSSQPRGVRCTALTVYEFDAQFNVVQQRYCALTCPPLYSTTYPALMFRVYAGRWRTYRSERRAQSVKRVFISFPRTHLSVCLCLQDGDDPRLRVLPRLPGDGALLCLHAQPFVLRPPTLSAGHQGEHFFWSIKGTTATIT
jgi:hypothetical protein